jgi:NhaP-type Na+/H+ or K+/H+ antiporter
MSPSLLGAILVGALLAGFAAGWMGGRALRWTMPNVLTATAVLIAGSLGGPVMSERLIGQGPASYLVAVLIAGFAAGLTFWPMGETQGQRQGL